MATASGPVDDEPVVQLVPGTSEKQTEEKLARELREPISGLTRCVAHGSESDVSDLARLPPARSAEPEIATPIGAAAEMIFDRVFRGVGRPRRTVELRKPAYARRLHHHVPHVGGERPAPVAKRPLPMS